MPDDDDKKAEPVQPYTSDEVKPATEFPPDPPRRPGDETRVMTPYRQGTHGESGTFPGGVVKDFRPHVLPSDAEEAEAEPAPKDFSAQESAESSSGTDSPQTTTNANPSPERLATKTVVKGSGLRKESAKSSQTSSTTKAKKSGSDSPPVETKPQTGE